MSLDRSRIRHGLGFVDRECDPRQGMVMRFMCEALETLGAELLTGLVRDALDDARQRWVEGDTSVDLGPIRAEVWAGRSSEATSMQDHAVRALLCVLYSDEIPDLASVLGAFLDEIEVLDIDPTRITELATPSWMST